MAFTRNARRNGEHGQAMIVAALAFAVLCGMAAMTIDLGLFYIERRSLQNAADAAVLAGATELPDTFAAEAKAREWAAKNGVGQRGWEIENITFSDGIPHGPGQKKITMRLVDRDVPYLFGRVLGLTSTELRAQAAAWQDGNSAGTYAIIVLNPTVCLAFDNTGSGNIRIQDGGIMVNSSCSPSARHAGSGNIEVGMFHYYERGSFTEVGSGNVTPDPQPVANPVADPLAGLAPPSPGAPSPDSEGTADSPKLTLINNSNDRTLRPGTYYGGLKIVGSGKVKMEPGLYIVAGGGLEINASGNVSGTGVTFYNTNDPAKPTGAGDYGRFKLTSSGNINLGAPTSGPYPYMLLWQDRGNTLTFLKATSGNLSPGIIYLPKARLDESSSGNLGAVQIIVDTYDKSGSGNVEMDSGGWVGASPSRIRLVE